MFAWDPHLNASVAVTNLTINGTTFSYFNPFNFTGQPFFLRLDQFKPGLSQSDAGNQLYAFHYAVNCVLPVSGIYCPLNRWLLFAEMFFGLGALSLGFEWLSVLAIAAALNYTAVGAIHAIVLYILRSQRVLYVTFDTSTLYEILGVSILLAHPLQQWSQTLQKKTFAKTRFIVACWCVLVCISFILVDVGLDNFQFEAPITGVQSSTQIPLGFGLSIQDFPFDGYFNDTINPFPLEISPKEWRNINGQVTQCPDTDPRFLSSIYASQNLVPNLFPVSSLNFSVGFLGLNYAFSVYSVIASIATILLAFHGQHSTQFVRAKTYLWVRGTGGSRRWRSKAGVFITMFYHAIQFLLGIVSIPIAFITVIINEASSVDITPTSEVFTDLGQWGPCVGALLLACVVILNTGSTAHILRSTLLWMIFAPAHALFPTKIKRRRLPHLEVDWSLFGRAQELPRWVALFFVEEFISTRNFLRHPYEASLECIKDEEFKRVEPQEGQDKAQDKGISMVAVSRANLSTPP